MFSPKLLTQYLAKLLLLKVKLKFIFNKELDIAILFLFHVTAFIVLYSYHSFSRNRFQINFNVFILKLDFLAYLVKISITNKLTVIGSCLPISSIGLCGDWGG